MKRCLLVIAVLLFALNRTSAQKVTLSPDSLFFAPDTVCVRQPVTLMPDTTAFNALSYYWGFCSGYMMNAPAGTNMGNNFGFHIPSGIDIVSDSGNYYGFVVNAETNEFLRLNFGNSLSNTPTVTNFGNVGGGLPVNPTSLYPVKDTFSKQWFVFVTGGFDAATSTIGRVDFGLSLKNPKPNVANFGNFGNVLNYPRGIFVAQDTDYSWFGYVVNSATGELIRLDFSYNISYTPRMFNYGNITDPVSASTILNHPTDIAAVYDHHQWYLFITNEIAASTIARVDLGRYYAPDPVDITGTTIHDSDPAHPPGTVQSNTFNFRINNPSSITITRDCGNLYAYVTDSTTHQLVSIQMQTVTGPYGNGVDYGVVGGTFWPSSISRILRDKDNLYGFIVNPGDSSLTRISLLQCSNASIQSFTEVRPPAYSYNAPGIYNVYMVINDGTPQMRVDCKPITVVDFPPLTISTDTTICEGDTIRLFVRSTQADSFVWTSNYRIDTTHIAVDSAKVYPDYSTTYPVSIFYPSGCIIDTSVKVNISKVRADAGPDRWIKDGATTTIGGPGTTLDGQYAFHWQPFQYLSDSTQPNPFAFPPYDYTYYLTVTELNDTLGCKAMDTVVVHVDCGDFHVPNAFAPNSINSTVARFGILNKELIKLNYLRVFDRWGVLVFETTDPNQGWDGTYNNQAEPVGVYVWEADGFCQDGRHLKKKGNVTLLR